MPGWLVSYQGFLYESAKAIMLFNNLITFDIGVNNKLLKSVLPARNLVKLKRLGSVNA